MAPITINRTPFNALVDDPGNNLEGSLWDKNQIKTVLLDPIDGALAKVPVDAATGKIPDSALSTNIALLNRANQTFTAQQIFGAVLQAAANLYADGGLIVRNIGIDLQAGAISFPATQVPSASPNALDDYEEGTWTPNDASGAGLAFSGASGVYIKVGSKVVVGGTLTFPSTAAAQQATLGGLPFPIINAGNLFGGSIGYTTVNALHTMLASANTTTASFTRVPARRCPIVRYSGKTLVFSLTYRTP